MKTTWSHIGAWLLCFCVTFYGATSNAGLMMGAGTTEMVICSGDGFATITVNADGTPVSPSPQCCDCLMCNAPTTTFFGDAFQDQVAPSQFSKSTVATTHLTPAPLIISRPQARGPPPVNIDNGVRAVLFCGLVCKDTTA